MRVPIAAELLDDDEDVLVDLRPHWIFFTGPLLLTAVAVAMAVVVTVQFPKAPVEVAWVLAALVGVPACWFLARLARWFGTSLIVTDRRIVLRTGVLGRQVINLRLQRVVDSHCSQRPLERLIGSGRVVLEVEGEEGGLALDDVRRPRSLQRLITRQLGLIDATRGPRYSSPGRWQSTVALERPDRTPPAGVPVSRAPGAADLIADQLIALDRLRQQGIVTDDEFASKKAELLRRM